MEIEVDEGGKGMIREKMEFEDKVLTCIGCGLDFTFTSGEQRYFWSKELSEPKRCPLCRLDRKSRLVREGMNNGSTNSSSTG